MNNVVQGNFGRRKERFDRESYLESRGADFMIATRSGSYRGPFSEGPYEVCHRIWQMFNAMDAQWGGDASSCVFLAHYDDKSGTQIDVQISRGCLACGPEREIEEGTHQIASEHETFFACVEVRDDMEVSA